MRHSIDYVGAHWRPKPKNQARLRAVDLEARVDIVLSLLQQDPAGCLNGLLFEMSAGPVVYNQIDRALLRLRQLDTPKSAVAVVCLDRFVERLLETIDSYQPSFVLSVKRFKELSPLLWSDFASLLLCVPPTVRGGRG